MSMPAYLERSVSCAMSALARPRGLILACLALALVQSACAPFAPLRPLFVAAALVQGAVVLLAWRRGALSTRQVVIVAILLRAIMLWLPPTLSDDAWRYLWDGTVQVHGHGPYDFEPRAAPAELRALPLYARPIHHAFYSVYPPLSQAVFAAVAFIADERPWLALYALKLLLSLAEVAGLLLLARLVEPRALLLYAWHPLVVLESAGQAHTESLLVPLLIACIWAAQRARPHSAGAALGAAVMVKLYPLALLPFLWRRCGWPAIWASVAVMFLLALPYASLDALSNVRESLALYATYFEFNAAPYFLVRDLANCYEYTDRDLGKLAVGHFMQAAFALSLPVLVVLDWRRSWPLDKAMSVTLCLLLALSTTVHPWYLVGLVALPWTLGGNGRAPQWPWLWLSVMSLGTYLRPTHGEAAYLAFVWLGWSGLAVLLIAPAMPGMLQLTMRWRARGKLRVLSGALGELPTNARMLDLGAGEGYVGQALAQRTGARVVLADVIDLRHVDVPMLVYDGQRLPLADEAFDAVILCYVLHHSRRPARVLAEALRVCKPDGRVVVLESVYRTRRERRLLDKLDRLANRLRSGGRMSAQEQHLRFRRAPAWRRLAERLGAEVVSLREFGRPPHRQALLTLRPRGATGRTPSAAGDPCLEPGADTEHGSPTSECVRSVAPGARSSTTIRTR